MPRTLFVCGVMLTDREREAFACRWVEELSESDTADRMRVSARRVRYLTASVRRCFADKGIDLSLHGQGSDNTLGHAMATSEIGGNFNLDRINAA